MSPERVGEVLKSGINRILGLGPVFGPTQEERDVMMGVLAAMNAKTDIVSVITPFVGDSAAQEAKK